MGIVGRDELLRAARGLYAAKASIQRSRMDVLSPPAPRFLLLSFPRAFFPPSK